MDIHYIHVMRLFNVSRSHKTKIFLKIQWFVNLSFFLVCDKGFCLHCKKIDQGILGIYCLVILLSPFDLLVNVTQTEFWFSLRRHSQL